MKNFIAKLIVFFVAVFPISAGAVSMSLEAFPYKFGNKNLIKADLLLDTKGEVINSLELEISVEDASIVGAEHGESIISIWVQSPSFEKNILAMTGIIPGGYNSNTYSGQENISSADKVLSIFLEPKSNTSTPRVILSKENSKVLRNDGLGTEINIESYELALDLKKNAKISLEGVADQTPPQNVSYEIVEDSTLVEDGHRLILFSAQDRDSGISHFEVKYRFKDWQVAQNPHHTKNVNNITHIKAVDASGNETILKITKAVYMPIVIGFIVALGVTAMIVAVARQRRIRKKAKLD